MKALVYFTAALFGAAIGTALAPHWPDILLSARGGYVFLGLDALDRFKAADAMF